MADTDISLPVPTIGRRSSIATPTLLDTTTGKVLLAKGYNVDTAGNYGDIGVVVKGSAGAVLQGDVNNLTSAQIANLLDVLAVGRYNATLPTITDGRFNSLQVGSRGSLNIQIKGADAVAGADVANFNSDGLTVNSAQPLGLYALSLPFAYNGTGADRVRNNTEATVLSSAARAGTVNSSDQTNYNGRGAIFWLNISAAPGADTVTMKIQWKDPVSGTYSDIIASVAISATGLTVMRVYPGITASANSAASMVLPRTYRVRVEHSGSGSFTYSVGSATIL